MALPRPRRIFGRERLSRITRHADTPHPAQRASVENINADGTVDLRMPDGLVTNVEVGDWYVPKGGDVVRVFRADPFSLFVLGAIKTANATTVEVANSVQFPYNVYPVPATSPPDPGFTSGTSTFTATDTGSWRQLDGWSRSDVFQGTANPTYGYWRGLYFYGSAPLSLRGKIVTSGSIRISRATTDGNATNVGQYLAPHAHSIRPVTGPYFTGAGRNIGAVDRGEALELAIPTTWLQLLVNGSATVRGFGHAINGTGPYYSRAKGKALDPLTGRLTIHWRT